MTFAIDLSQQVALVTGGTQGIGRAIVEGLLQAGARVAFCAVDAAECDEAARELAERHDKARILAVSADLHDRASLSAFAETALSAWGKIDVLVCNAADFGKPTSVGDVDIEVFLRVLQANVANNFHLCRAVLPGMVERRNGSIVLITSITGYTAMPTNIPYAASKAAIASIGRSLAAEYAPLGIRVNCLSPGLIKTHSSRDIWSNEDLARTYIPEKIPMGRMGEPQDIAAACVFLASPLARYVTAATIAVDGGRLGIGQATGTGSTEQARRVSS